MTSRLALGVVATTFVAASAHAQIAPDGMLAGRQPRQVDLHAQARVDYDTNLPRSNATSAALRGLAKEDTLFTPVLDGTVVMPVGQQVVFIKGRVQYLFHDKNTQLDHNSISGQAGFGGKLGPCGGTLIGGYVRGRTELDNVVLIERVENLIETKRVDVSATCVNSTGLGLVVSAGEVWGDNSLPILRTSDYETRSASAGINYGRPRSGSIGVNASYARTEYPNRPTLTGRTDGYELKAIGVQARRQFGARIQGSVSGGYTHVELLQPAPVLPGAPGSTLSEFEGFTYSANLSYRASGRLTVRGAFERSISPSLISGQSYEVQTNYQLNADYRLGSRITVGAGVTQQEADSRGTALAGLALTESRTRSLISSITYRQSRHISLVLAARHQNRTADNPLFKYSSNRFSLTTDYKF